MRRRRAVLRLKALHGRPCLDQGAVYREVFTREERSDLRVRQDRGHKLARHVGRQQPITVLGKHRRDPDRLVDAKADEPPKQQVVVHLFHQLPFRAN